MMAKINPLHRIVLSSKTKKKKRILVRALWVILRDAVALSLKRAFSLVTNLTDRFVLTRLSLYPSIL